LDFNIWEKINDETMEKYDLVVIGAGPSGYAGAMRAIDFNKKVLVVEKDRIGGAGIYNGALWSKSMWEYSEKVKVIREFKEPNKEPVSWDSMMGVVESALLDRKMQMTLHLDLLHKQTTENGIHYEKGEARLIDNHTVEIKKHNGTFKTISIYLTCYRQQAPLFARYSY
jgi:dihydrolipoamide dehydrogenase